MSIVNIAEDQVKKAAATRVDKIELEIGDLAGIELSALDFAWGPATRNSVLEHAEREIIQIPGRARCMECDAEFQVENLFDLCPQCQSFVTELLSGKGLRVKALTVS